MASDALLISLSNICLRLNGAWKMGWKWWRKKRRRDRDEKGVNCRISPLSRLFAAEKTPYTNRHRFHSRHVSVCPHYRHTECEKRRQAKGLKGRKASRRAAGWEKMMQCCCVDVMKKDEERRRREMERERREKRCRRAEMHRPIWVQKAFGDCKGLQLCLAAMQTKGCGSCGAENDARDACLPFIWPKVIAARHFSLDYRPRALNASQHLPHLWPYYFTLSMMIMIALWLWWAV